VNWWAGEGGGREGVWHELAETEQDAWIKSPPVSNTSQDIHWDKTGPTPSPFSAFLRRVDELKLQHYANKRYIVSTTCPRLFFRMQVSNWLNTRILVRFWRNLGRSSCFIKYIGLPVVIWLLFDIVNRMCKEAYKLYL